MTEQQKTNLIHQAMTTALEENGYTKYAANSPSSTKSKPSNSTLGGKRVSFTDVTTSLATYKSNRQKQQNNYKKQLEKQSKQAVPEQPPPDNLQSRLSNFSNNFKNMVSQPPKNYLVAGNATNKVAVSYSGQQIRKEIDERKAMLEQAHIYENYTTPVLAGNDSRLTDALLRLKTKHLSPTNKGEVYKQVSEARDAAMSVPAQLLKNYGTTVTGFLGLNRKSNEFDLAQNKDMTYASSHISPTDMSSFHTFIGNKADTNKGMQSQYSNPTTALLSQFNKARTRANPVSYSDYFSQYSNQL